MNTKNPNATRPTIHITLHDPKSSRARIKWADERTETPQQQAGPAKAREQHVCWEAPREGAD